MSRTQAVAVATEPETADGGFRPIRLIEVELSRPLPSLEGARPGSRFGTAWVLVRLFGEPVGLVPVELPPSGALTPDALRVRLDEAVGREIQEREATAPEVIQPQPFISVVVCTRGRPRQLRGCLAAVCRQDYPAFELVVVDNAPTDDSVARLVDELQLETDVRVRRAVEPIPGLSRARNTGAAAAHGDLIAYIDDDELPDERWLAELAAGFAADDGVGCVTGMILPASLETEPQALFEEYGGHSKGRDFSQRIFHARRDCPQDPLYPLPPFGAGGNMAFTRDALAAIGGFDPALGAGTVTRGGEDTAAFTDVLLEGFKVVYRPGAFVWHHHYADLDGLRRQLAGYGTGLTCFYARLLLRRPRQLPRLVALLPRGIRDLRGTDSVRRERMSATFPPELLRAHRRGMLFGPLAYVISVMRQRRAGGAR